MKKIKVTLKNPNSVDLVLCCYKNCAEDGWNDKNNALYFNMAHYTTDTRYYKTFFTEEEIIEGGFAWTLNSSGVKDTDIERLERTYQGKGLFINAVPLYL